MIISVDTVRDSPETMRAAAKLILELAGESSVPREPVPPPLRVPDVAQPVRMVVPSPRVESTRAADLRPEPIVSKPAPVAHEANGFEELGLEIYDDNEPTPRSVSIAVSETRKEQQREEKKPEKPSNRLPGGVQVY